MNNKCTQAEFGEIEDLVKNALSAPNKQMAKTYLDKLVGKKKLFSAPTNNMYSDLVDFVKDAVGRVADKDWKVARAIDYLNKFRLLCVER